jgi:hypothetical protein
MASRADEKCRRKQMLVETGAFSGLFINSINVSPFLPFEPEKFCFVGKCYFNK